MNLRSALDGERNAHPATDAQRRQPALGIALLHLVQQRHEDARTRSTNWMADGDGVDFYDVGVPSHVLVDRDRLRGERLVRLDEIKVGNFPAGLLERPPRGGNWAWAHDGRICAGGGPGGDGGGGRG